MLDRYLLRYFLAVIDQGNFSKAAIACNVAQPTLSVGIAKLERMLGQPLFIRSNQRVELTVAGTKFVNHARRIEREFHAAMRSMEIPLPTAPLRLGFLNSVPGDLLAGSIENVPGDDGYRLEILFGSERELTGHLAKGRIDLALTLVDRGGDRFLERAIMTEGYSLAVTDRHPLAAEIEVAPEQLALDVMIVRRHCEALSSTSRYFTDRGVRPHFALRSTNDERVMQMVAAGLGITVMPACYRHPRIMRPRLSGFDVSRTLGWAAGHKAEPLLSTPPSIISSIEQQLIKAHELRE